MAAFADPQGAVLSVWQPKENIGAGLVNAPGALSWNDLLSPDVEASAAFYRALSLGTMSVVSPTTIPVRGIRPSSAFP